MAAKTARRTLESEIKEETKTDINDDDEGRHAWRSMYERLRTKDWVRMGTYNILIHVRISVAHVASSERVQPIRADVSR